MSEIADTGHPTTALNVVHESYAFACMRCGHGWEQSYEIEHHVDATGQEFVTYLADGARVPSPLTRPTCLNCGGHVVRIMRAGQVSSVLDMMRRQHAGAAKGVGKPAGPVDAVEPGADGAGEGDGAGRHHWHLSDLLHPFQHRRAH
ncbi:hypothetical protein DEJ48_23045 [Streptomyces venezuelae]|uniref:C2H2-type domain-containing protein n=1 Tax=Streptomyces venezuelae TaxID=54571 RepID=A0A5P2BZH5_STRVZ|nr:hypothetical protein [Streptomyces venezuelae]QES35906.1 hypothetical protein DEJ48_23045 [Streptomyces venezuelae]